MNIPRAGGGWQAIRYAFATARRSGGLLRFYKAMRSRNACKTCAVGMGGQLGGMTNEAGHFLEVCKKSMQAMAADMQGRVGPEFFQRYGFDEMQRMSPHDLEHMGRLADPLFAGPDDRGYRPIGWDEALRRCADALKASRPDESFFYFSGRSSNEAAFLAQLFGRLYGTNNVCNCSYYCHQASGVGLASAVGSGTATVTLDDLEHCDLVLLIGANPASNHPRLMSTLMRLRRRGGQVVVINPIREPGLVRFRVPSDVRSLLLGTDIASDYVQPHLGGDLALLVGIAKRVCELKATDAAFLAAHCSGAEALQENLADTSWDDIVTSSGVDHATIDRVARAYARSNAAIFAWTMGITHHRHGVDNVRAIANLALLRGMVGRPNAGLMPIRGHSNVQGIGSVGVSPALRDAVFARLKSRLGVTLPTAPGLDPLAAIDALLAGRVRTVLCVGGNLFGATPDAAAAARAFANAESVVYLSTTLNTGHASGRGRQTLVLPVRARDEEAQPTTQESMFNYVRLSDGGPPRLDGPRGEVEIIAELASAVLGDHGPVDWRALREHRSIRRLIGEIVPGYEDISRIDDTRREFHVGGRVLHEPRFPTPSGRARLHQTPLPVLRRGPGELLLATIRSEGQFNTVVYEEFDLYRGQDRRDVILMNPADIERLGLRAEQRVVVRSAAGEWPGVRVRPFDIRAGNAAMYYPEANVLVPRDADPESRTPAYKSITVTVAPFNGPQPLRVRVAEGVGHTGERENKRC